ncbi:uncharacterized protein [Littorina saxatilis]|uniref:Uncharacterized protein n=1 Tax=Littorina saxatilis TaxID=31220 RepID=A0AAN9BQF5_9CAEN
MPTGLCDVTTMTHVTDVTDAELEREFRAKEKGEEENIEEETADDSGGNAGGPPSSGRPSSSDSLKTNSACSDQNFEDTCSSSERKTMPTVKDEGKRKKGQSHASIWQSVKRAGGELNQDTRKMFRFIGRKLNSRHGPRETKVKEIHILPGEDDADRMWARRIAGSANSHSSSGSEATT